MFYIFSIQVWWEFRIRGPYGSLSMSYIYTVSMHVFEVEVNDGKAIAYRIFTIGNLVRDDGLAPRMHRRLLVSRLRRHCVGW